MSFYVYIKFNVFLYIKLNVSIFKIISKTIYTGEHNLKVKTVNAFSKRNISKKNQKNRKIFNYENISSDFQAIFHYNSDCQHLEKSQNA